MEFGCSYLPPELWKIIAESIDLVSDWKSFRLICKLFWNVSYARFKIEGIHCIKTLQGHHDYITCLIVVQDKFIISGSWDKTIKLWDITSGDCIKTLHGHNDSVHCLTTFQNKFIISGSSSHTIKLWGLENINSQKNL